MFNKILKVFGHLENLQLRASNCNRMSNSSHSSVLRTIYSKYHPLFP